MASASAPAAPSSWAADRYARQALMAAASAPAAPSVGVHPRPPPALGLPGADVGGVHIGANDEEANDVFIGEPLGEAMAACRTPSPWDSPRWTPAHAATAALPSVPAFPELGPLPVPVLSDAGVGDPGPCEALQDRLEAVIRELQPQGGWTEEQWGRVQLLRHLTLERKQAAPRSFHEGDEGDDDLGSGEYSDPFNEFDADGIELCYDLQQAGVVK